MIFIFFPDQKTNTINIKLMTLNKERDLPKLWPEPQKYACGCVGSGLHVHALE